jgi:hypothetical protein
VLKLPRSYDIQNVYVWGIPDTNMGIVGPYLLGWYYLKSPACWYNLWGWYCLSSWETGRVLAVPSVDTRHMPIHHTQHWFKPTIDKIRNVPWGYPRNELLVHSNNGWTFHKCENEWKLSSSLFCSGSLTRRFNKVW